jgi:hypothetical protein
MKKSNSCRVFLTIALAAVCSTVVPASIYAEQPGQTQKNAVVAPRLFASPDEAVKALQAAAEAKDKPALDEIFGSEVKELLTGDSVQDAKNAKKFASSLALGYTLVKDGDDKITIEVGTNNWPMPIPLTKANEQWYFNTAAGKEEIINRHIGKDELHAVGVCRTYVKAQLQFAGMNPDASKGTKYAQKFKSTIGKMDGLYWPHVDNKAAAPFGPDVAEADIEVYAENKGAKPQSFHGYYFKILTRQGKDAPGGKMNYMDHGNLALGFALVAFPAHWDRSGIMTFVVNEKGQVFQRNLGEKTFHSAVGMNEYNPDSEWTLVNDDGIVSAATEK